MIDVWLKITGTKRQVRDAFQTMDLDTEMLRRDDDGNLELAGFNHHVAMLYVPDLITAFATYDADGNELTPATFAGPHLMIRFVSKATQQKARTKIIEAGELPPGLERVAAPTTMKWAGDA